MGLVMITCNLMGGLGNYMFQITAAYSLALDNEDSLVLNNKTSVSVHKHIDTYRNNILRNLTYGETTTDKIYSKPFFHYNEIPYTPNLKLNGYYQSEKYFKHNRNKVLECFSIDTESRKYIDRKYGDILKNKTCSIHVRRGDYLGLSNIHPPCSLSYYNEAVKQVDDDVVYLVFSDDIEWCKENLKFGIYILLRVILIT